jgi:glyoxylase-like metal-dependent hydrolase (beta-lactamase superfamily II)
MQMDRESMMSAAVYQIECVESAPFSQNSYVVWKPGRTDALIVDPGFDFQSIQKILKSNGLSVAAILNTHGHADHIAGNARAKAAFPGAPLIIGRNEEYLLADPEANLSSAYGMPIVSPPADQLVDHGETLEIAGIRMQVREIPGHSPGSVIFILDEFSPQVVLVGDVIFAGSVGRTDFPGGSGPTLYKGIKSHLYTLPDDTILWPGHGPSTTVGDEKATNPFVRGDSVR